MDDELLAALRAVADDLRQIQASDLSLRERIALEELRQALLRLRADTWPSTHWVDARPPGTFWGCDHVSDSCPDCSPDCIPVDQIDRAGPLEPGGAC